VKEAQTRDRETDRERYTETHKDTEQWKHIVGEKEEKKEGQLD
jgi:hypothetical protein